MYCIRQKIVVAFVLLSLTATGIDKVLMKHVHTDTLNGILFPLIFFVIPVTVLVINAVVVRQIRRSYSNHALHHQQSLTSSSKSAVPTVMLVTTSVIHALLTCCRYLGIVVYWHRNIAMCDDRRLSFSYVYLVVELHELMYARV